MSIKMTPNLEPYAEISQEIAESLWKSLEAPMPPGFQPGHFDVKFTLSNGMTHRGVEVVDFGPRCECGSDKVGSPRHSTWCPKHEGER